MVGTGGPSPKITLSSDPPPSRIATNAEGRSMAAPQARPECTPVAAYRSLDGCPMIAAGNDEHVGTASRRIAVGTFDEPCAIRQDVRRGHQGPLNHTSPSEPGVLPCAIEQRAELARLSGCGPR